jgi:hypothetical protein
VAFGFLPREFNNTAVDRYIYEEDQDVTEMYFITKGTWAICFKSPDSSYRKILMNDPKI